MRKIVLAFLLLLTTATFAAADTIYLRDGRTVRGTVLGFVGGRFAVRLTAAVGPPTVMQTGTQSSNNARITGEIGDVIFLRTRDIERVEIDGRSLDDARYLTRTVQVELGPNWVDTGIDLKRNERISISASGTIVAGRTRITPGGLRSTDPNAPLPRAAEGVLIGAIGNDPNSPIIEVGINREFVADRDGRLYLTANRSSYTDARGAYTAQIRREINFNQRAGNRRNNTDDDFDDLFGTGDESSGPAGVRPRNTTGGQYPTETSTETSTRERNITVPGNSRGTDTGVDLRSGDSVTITATGTVTAGRRAGDVSPDGGRAGLGGALLGTRPVPAAGVGALIGYIRLANGQSTQAFLVGSQQTITAPADGRLFLLINDDNYADNSGGFDVRIVQTGSQGTFGGGGGSAQGLEKTLDVYANTRDTDTGIELRAGDRVTFSATGTIFSRGSGAISPEGNRRYDSVNNNYPVRDAAFGALVGYIRLSNGQASRPFFIGSQQTVIAPDSGRLFLLVNDDDSRDNSGSFRVRIVY
ncbi:MAG TPA: LecA/PA-IL family lectin [Pyrinomonadaceae bacterium]|nr:LecA/PA-IL family lectin [Pyrinomonadaceae bacterium]